MMTSLLSTFDPSCSAVISNWLYLFFVMVFSTSIMWKEKSLIQQFFFLMINFLPKLFMCTLKSELYIVSLFFFFLLINLMGIIPYSFSFTSHFSFNFCFSLSLWLSSMVWGFSKNLAHNIAHITPSGCPLVLTPFMVMVESISLLIRPITLSLRLMSNMLAGHMIISLLCKGCYSISWMLKPCFFSMTIFFLVFEMGVALIQAYVFSMLLNLYWKDTES